MNVPAAESTVPAKLTNVQALRALAAFLVVASHVGDSHGGFEKLFLLPSRIDLLRFENIGHYGVDLFFVISGFIMTVTAWNEFGRPAKSREFILRRLVRIYPPYWVICLAVLVVYLADPKLINPSSPVRPDIAASFLLLPQAGEPLLLVSWTLVFEMAFYCVFAVALCFQRRALPVVLLVWAIVIVLCEFLFSSSSNPYLRFLGVQMPFEFFFGIVAGALVATRRQRMPVAAISVGIVLAAWLFIVPETNPQVPSPLLWFRVALAGAAFSTLLYGLVVTEIRGTFRAGKAGDVLGDASYAIYLWHLPVLTALGLGILRFPPVLRSLHEFWIAVGFAAVFATGIIVFRIIERPLTGYLNRRLKQHLPAS